MPAIYRKKLYKHYSEIIPAFTVHVPLTRTRKQTLCWKGVDSLVIDNDLSWVKSCLFIGNSINYNKKQNRCNLKMSQTWLEEARKHSPILNKLIIDILASCTTEFKDKMNSDLEVYAGISICRPTLSKNHNIRVGWHNDSNSEVHRVFWLPLIHDGEKQTGGTLFLNENSDTLHNTVVGTVETWLAKECHRGTLNTSKMARVALYLDIVEEKYGVKDGTQL